MSKTLTLTDLIVTQLLINYEKQYVYCEYKMVDVDGKQWDTGIAYFWVTMPAEPSEKDFQLPSSYFPTLLSLQSDADAALSARFLV